MKCQNCDCKIKQQLFGSLCEDCWVLAGPHMSGKRGDMPIGQYQTGMNGRDRIPIIRDMNSPASRAEYLGR